MLVGSKGFGSCENTIGAIVDSVDDDGAVDGCSNEVDDSRSDDKELDDSVDDSMDSGTGEHTTKLKNCMLNQICWKWNDDSNVELYEQHVKNVIQFEIQSFIISAQLSEMISLKSE